jgi:hypothetical protein
MCLPGIGMAVGLAQGIMGFMGQQQQYQAQKDQYEANLQNAKTSTFERYDQINTRVEQENAKESQDLQQASIQAVQARGAARTAAAESHVGGLSVSNVLGDMYAQEGRYQRNTTVNFDYTRDYYKGEGAATRAQGQNEINSVPEPTAPNPFAAMLNIFGQAVGNYAQFNPSGGSLFG